MKLSTPTPAHRTLESDVHSLCRYLERLANAWEYASERDLDVLDRILGELERSASPAGERGSAPATIDAYLAVVRHALARARGSRADVRMQHLEGAREAAEVLRERVRRAV